VRTRALERLSGGQRQRVAIGAALTAHPKVLVLDEPTSALDPQAAEDVLALLQRLVHDLGLTVLLAEHRLERVVQYADTVVVVPGRDGRGVVAGRPDVVLGAAPVAPPIVELGRLAGWSPLPLSVRDARRQAVGLRGRLAALAPAAAPAPVGNPPDAREPVAYVRGLIVRYGEQVALRGVDVSLHAGEVTALMGRNGAGKSTLLAALVGLRKAGAGEVRVGGADPGRLEARDLVRRVGLVPQDAADLLYADSVAAECGQADRDVHAGAGSALALLEQLSPGIDPLTHPGDLSEGQRLALSLTVVMVGEPPVLLLDEPTRGLDYPAKRRLTATLRDLAARGHAVLLATHDVELVAEVADRVVVLGDGEVVADGPSAEVVVASPVFAPQVAKVLAPLPFLTVTQVAQVLAAG
jgi:energy-coupling factor transport system ATP-binding protein